VRLTLSSGNLGELYVAQANPFTIFYHRDHFRTIHFWFCGIPMISIISVIIGHNLIKYTKCVIGTILSEGIHECNSSLEPRQKDLEVGMLKKGLPASANVSEAN
jgi:hypothetical protein